MNTTALHSGTHIDSHVGAHESAQWPIAGLFLDSLGRRDFQSMASCLDRDVRFRALVPRGPFELTGSADVAERFERWFGGGDEFEVVDASIGQVGGCLYFRWRIRMSSESDPHSARIVEQHAFARVGERIESIDLLCSGFHAEGVAKEES